MKPATTTIAEMRGGALNDELSKAIQDAAAAVRATGRAATVTLELKINPYDGDEGEVERVSVSDKVKTKLPEPKKRDSVFFITSGNDLTRQNVINGEVDQTHNANGTAKSA